MTHCQNCGKPEREHLSGIYCYASHGEHFRPALVAETPTPDAALPACRLCGSAVSRPMRHDEVYHPAGQSPATCPLIRAGLTKNQWIALMSPAPAAPSKSVEAESVLAKLKRYGLTGDEDPQFMVDEKPDGRYLDFDDTLAALSSFTLTPKPKVEEA